MHFVIILARIGPEYYRLKLSKQGKLPIDKFISLYTWIVIQNCYNKHLWQKLLNEAEYTVVAT